MKPTSIAICVHMPRTISSFPNPLAERKRPGFRAMQIAPSTMIESVYSARFIRRIEVVIAPGMPSRIIRTAEAGCPPVAEGVIAEK